MQFQISSRKKTGKEINWVIKIRVSENFSAKNLRWDAEDNPSGPLNKGGIVDGNSIGNLLKVQTAKSVRLDLILTMSDIYINFNLNALTKFTSSSRSTEFKGIIPWNISQMITKTVPISTSILLRLPPLCSIVFLIRSKYSQYLWKG